MSNLWQTIGVMAYVGVLAAITVVAVAFILVEWWRGRGG